MMRASTLISFVICRFVLSRALIIDNQLKIIKNDCFERFAIGHKLNSNDVYESVEVKIVKDCQRLCTLDEEKCRSFTFGIGTHGNATCNLSSKVLKETADLKPIGTIHDPDYDLYIKKLGCKLVVEEKPEITIHETDHPHQTPLPESQTITAQLSSNPSSQHHSPQDHSYPPKPLGEKDGERVHTSLISIRPDPHRPGYTGLGPALGYHDSHNPNHANVDRNDQQYYRPYHDYYSESRPHFPSNEYHGEISRPKPERPVDYVNEIPKPGFEKERVKPYYEKYRPYSRPGDRRPYSGRPLGEYGRPHVGYGSYDEYERPQRPVIEYVKPVVVINPDVGYERPIDDYKVSRRPFDMYAYYRPSSGYAQSLDRYDNFDRAPGYNKRPSYPGETIDRLSWGYNDRESNSYYGDYDKQAGDKEYQLHDKPYVRPVHEAGYAKPPSDYARPIIDHHKPSGGYEVATSSYNKPSGYTDKPVEEYVRPERPYERPTNYYKPIYEEATMGYGRPQMAYDRPYNYGKPQNGYGRPDGGYERPEGGYDRPLLVNDRPLSGYDKPQMGYDRPESGYDRPQNDFGRPQGGYVRPQGGYDRPEYERPQSGYDRPPKENERPLNEYDRPHDYERPNGYYSKPPKDYDRPLYERPVGHYGRPMGGDYMSRPYHYEHDRPDYIDSNKQYADGYTHWMKRPYGNQHYLRPYDVSNPNAAHPEESKPVSEISPYLPSRNTTLVNEKDKNNSASDRYDSTSGSGKPFVSEMIGPHGEKVTSIITELSPSK